MSLQPFQHVLTRNFGGVWEADTFSHYERDTDDTWCVTIRGRYMSQNCIPYEKNEHLLGKEGEPERPFAFGDHVAVRDDDGQGWQEAVYLAYIDSYDEFKHKVIKRDGPCVMYMYKQCRRANW